MDRVIFRIVETKNRTTGKSEYRYEPIRVTDLLRAVRAEIAERSSIPQDICSAS